MGWDTYRGKIFIVIAFVLRIRYFPSIVEAWVCGYMGWHCRYMEWHCGYMVWHCGYEPLLGNWAGWLPLDSVPSSRRDIDRIEIKKKNFLGKEQGMCSSNSTPRIRDIMERWKNECNKTIDANRQIGVGLTTSN